MGETSGREPGPDSASPLLPCLCQGLPSFLRCQDKCPCLMPWGVAAMQGPSALTSPSQPEPMIFTEGGAPLKLIKGIRKVGPCLSPFHGFLPGPSLVPHPYCSVRL